MNTKSKNLKFKTDSKLKESIILRSTTYNFQNLSCFFSCTYSQKFKGFEFYTIVKYFKFKKASFVFKKINAI